MFSPVLTALLAALASALVVSLRRLWRVRSFFTELRKRGLVEFSILLHRL
jgi:hypothetical protein